jgi:hypothetical protein
MRAGATGATGVIGKAEPERVDYWRMLDTTGTNSNGNTGNYGYYWLILANGYYWANTL